MGVTLAAFSFVGNMPVLKLRSVKNDNGGESSSAASFISKAGRLSIPAAFDVLIDFTTLIVSEMSTS